MVIYGLCVRLRAVYVNLRAIESVGLGKSSWPMPRVKSPALPGGARKKALGKPDDEIRCKKSTITWIIFGLLAVGAVSLTSYRLGSISSERAAGTLTFHALMLKFHFNCICCGLRDTNTPSLRSLQEAPC